jgi:hypothetical protein
MASSFAFRMRAYAAAHFEFDEILTLTWPDAVAFVQSEYSGGDDGQAYPVTLHAEIRGEGESLEEAEPRLARAIGNTLPVIALASNAAVADPLPVAAHGLDLSEPQPFVGYKTPAAEEWFPPGQRGIDLDATLNLMAAVGQHPQGDCLGRAIEMYRRALGYWFPEQMLLAGEFLSIAAETLSRFLIDSRAASQGISHTNLAKLNKLTTADRLRSHYLREEIFSGDTAAFQAMSDASNGFEHGYMSIDQVNGLLEPVLERSYGYIRRALIKATGVDEAVANTLLAEKYDEPRALVPVIRFVRGELALQDPSQPPSEMAGAPIELAWQESGPIAVKEPDGKVNLTFQTNVTATKLPANTQLGVLSFGMRAAYVTPSGEPIGVTVTRADGTKPAI